ncbi:hypothetical protein [Paeniglutamicibacter antarcticus]|uniref:Uncharacterized protein n=1 Tax=Paeniglutamicibacter antarcticus TaxID=494023 RepID=A0ABP9TRZ5_9MICC
MPARRPAGDWPGGLSISGGIAVMVLLGMGLGQERGKRVDQVGTFGSPQVRW